jgi:hypothetical protein
MTVRQILRSAAARAARSPDPARVQRASSCEVSADVRTLALVTSRLQTAIAAARFCGLAGRADVVAPVLVLEELDAERLPVVLWLVPVVLVAVAGVVVVLAVVLVLEAVVTLALAVLVAVEPLPPPPQPLASAAPSARRTISKLRRRVTAGM